MIKNIVFDLGGVVVDLNQRDYILSLNLSDDIKDILINMFSSKEWLDFEKGLLNFYEIKKSITNKYPKYRKEILAFLEVDVREYFPIKYDTVALARKLHNDGFNIYILSNTFEKAIENVRREKAFYDIVKGETLSYLVNSLKPESLIYEKFLMDNKLIPEETIFLDDNPININVANKFKINGIVFKNAKEAYKKIKIICEREKK